MLRAEIDFAGGRDQGDRASQQDYYTYSIPEDSNEENHLLLAVADGMGGHAAGDLASRKAVDAFFYSYFRSDYTDYRDRMLAAVGDANDCLRRLTEENREELEGMGTTLVVVEIEGRNLRWVSVGDSPFYLFRNGRLHRLNEEHSMRQVLEEKVRSGELSIDEAIHHPQRNHLLAALTGQPIEMVDSPPEPFQLRQDDLLLVCSDGVLTLDDDRIARTLEIYGAEDARQIVKRLLADVASRRKPKQDNTTAAVIKIGAWAPPRDDAPGPPFTLEQAPAHAPHQQT